MSLSAINYPLQIKDSTANPAPLGLMGFGMTTVLLNLHNAGLYEMKRRLSFRITSFSKRGTRYLLVVVPHLDDF